MADLDLERLAADCRRAAEDYKKHPGLAGPGANVDVIIDIYLTIARLADAALTTGKSDG